MSALTGQKQGGPWAVSVQSDRVAADASVQLLKVPLPSPRRNAACLKRNRPLIKGNSISFCVKTLLLLRNSFQEAPLFRAPRDK